MKSAEESTGAQSSSQVLNFKGNDSKGTSYLEKSNCKRGKPCVELCFSEHCSSTAAICNDLECECRLDHNNQKICSMGPLKAIVSKTEKKRHSFPQGLKWVNKKYDELVDWISDEREKLEQQMKSLGLNEDQKSFLKAVYEGECNKLTGKQMHKVVNDANLETKKLQQTTAQIQEQLSKQWQSCVEKIQKEVVSINSLITKTCLQGAEVKNDVDVLKPSKVLATETDRVTVVEMLENGSNSNKRKVSKIELLYRASDNDFSTEKFWERCDHKADTVTVALTEFDKVIGGYTPLSWKKEKHGNYQEDSSLRSFVFSVTEKTKFTLKQSQKQHAIYHFTGYGPLWGQETDFYLNNKANVTNSHAKNIGRTYENSKVQHNTKEAWQFFQGSTDNQYFKTKEWQVWQVTFE